MPRSPEKNAQIREKRKKKIMKKALKLFAMRGPNDVTVDEITSEVNCSHGLFYHYFTTIEDLYSQVLVVMGEEYKGYLDALDAASKARGRDGLQIIADYIEASSSKGKEAYFYARMHLTSSANEVGTGMTGSKEHQLFTRLIKEAQEDGTIHCGNAEETSLFFLDFISGMTYRHCMGESSDDATISAATIMALFN